MRRRFGRRRRGGSSDDGGRASTLDPQWLDRVASSGLVPATTLTQLEDDAAAGLALLGTGEAPDGERVLVAVSRSGGDALLALLASATRLAEAEGFHGAAIAVAPSWSLGARLRLGLARELPFALRGESAPFLDDLPRAVEAEPMEPPPVVAPEQVARHLAKPADVDLCQRAVAGLAGLAAKHGGAVRGVGRSVELVLLARRVAAVRVDEDGVLLDTLAGGRRTERLAPEALADALDRLEGLLRKHLNERENREGEPGLRARLLPRVVEAAGLRAVRRWPLGGRDQDALDFAGVTAAGRPAVGALRSALGLSSVGPILDGLVTLAPALPDLLASAAAPVRLESPCLVLAAERYDAAAVRVLGALAIEVIRWEISGAAGRDPELRRVEATSDAVADTSLRRPERRPERRDERPAREMRPGPDERPAREERPPREERLPRDQRSPRADRPSREASPFERPEPPRAPRSFEPAPAEGSLPGFSDYVPQPAGAESAAPDRDAEPRFGPVERAEPRFGPVERAEPRFEEVSLFDLGEDEGPAAAAGGEDAEGRRRGRRRRRGRGRGRARGGDGRSGEEGGGHADEPAPEDDRPVRQGARAPEPVESDDDGDVELGEGLAPLVADVPEFVEEPEPGYDDEEEPEEETESDPDRERMRRERERRRRARIAKADPLPEPPRPPRPPRPRRVAILAHADRDSLAAATLLARDLRMLEGVWVYPQADLMTFFRGVVPDLREETPIHVIGFTASPARETIQTASLYRDRLTWFDHHPWPPEDLEALREAIGREAVHVVPYTRSSIPLVLSTFQRRSRFSDKLVDLLAGRFTQHDFERWGRLWWTRLGEAAARTGDRRAEIEALLAGRPSDLTRDAARAATPPLPAEVEFVSGRDFRLVHFGGYTLVVVPVPPGLDVFLAARIARERYAAELSVAWPEGEETLVLASDEGTTRRSLDVLGMAEHLAGKHEWVDALPDADHVARVHVRGLASHPERLEDLLAEIAMGRSILEG